MQIVIDISKDRYDEIMSMDWKNGRRFFDEEIRAIHDGKALEQQPKIGHCKDCKYFEYDSVAKVDGIPLIVAHEICNKWGNGCKTKEDGYCFLYETQ